jgi:hypothetical protein
MMITLTSAMRNFSYSNLTNANFSNADLRGGIDWSPHVTTITHNTIRPDGSIQGLALLAGEKLAIRNNAIPITVTTSATFDSASTLQFQLADNWTSPIRFSPGLNPALGGNLQLAFADGVNLASQLGQTFNLFNWTSINHTGTFIVSSVYNWDLSQLYTTGNVTLLSLPKLGDFNNDGHVDAADISAMMVALSDLHGYEAAYDLSDPPLLLIGDINP